MSMESKLCILDRNKMCNDCGDCRCDLDPDKVCDNCMKCIFTGAEYNGIQIDQVISDGTGRLMIDLMENESDGNDSHKE